MQFCALPRLKGRVKVVLGGTLMKIKELIYGNLPMAGIFPYEGIYHPARPMCSKRIKRLILDRILPLIDIQKVYPEAQLWKMAKASISSQ
jgi:hypothetical protein